MSRINPNAIYKDLLLLDGDKKKIATPLPPKFNSTKFGDLFVAPFIFSDKTAWTRAA